MIVGDKVICPVGKDECFLYEVIAFHYSELGQESLVELRSITEKPHDVIKTSFVPEPILRSFVLIEADND